MYVSRALGSNLRLYRDFEIRPSGAFNLILGANGSGKTTLLEGLYLLSRARSFRANSVSELSGPVERNWNVYAEIARHEHTDRIGIGWNGVEQQQRVNGERVRNSALPRQLPLQLIDPAGHRLIEEGPGYRRSYLDWGVFHVEPSFYLNWQRYQRCLRQRNQALKQNLSSLAIAAWDEELSSTAEQISDSRRRHADALKDRLSAWLEELLDVRDAKSEFVQGWDDQLAFRTVLEQQLPQHRRLGSTSHGPHRAELKLWLTGQKAKGRVSRGQQKLLVAALVLAQCSVLIDAGQPAPVVLVDDFAAELSAAYQARFARALVKYPGQVFVTAFEPPVSLEKAESKLFHVEQGRITEVDRE